MRLEPVAIRLCRATFSYLGAPEPAFRDLTLDIPAGAVVAVTGPVGAGKSALARCLAGIYPPDSGDILLDGEPAQSMASRLVGYAPQDGYLFSGSVKENVFLGAEMLPAADESLSSLIELAGLQEDIAVLPNGVETQIGELGIRISGGQRQRLGLARAAGAYAPYTPGLLVLDDPFSAVDVDTEVRIIANLRAAFGPEAPADRRTTIVLFSHRLAAFSQADMVVVLTQGTIEEQGTHQELLRAGGLYSRIYQAQLQLERGAAREALAR